MGIYSQIPINKCPNFDGRIGVMRELIAVRSPRDGWIAASRRL